MHSIHNSY